MSELEQALVALGQELELPPAPDVTAAVRARVATRPRRLWPVAVALALVVAVAAALAVPQSRGAILRFFHIRGAEVTVVDSLPRAAITGEPPGAAVRLDDAPFRVLLPDGEPPDDVRLLGDLVWLRYGPAERPRLLVAELRTGSAVFLKKVAGQGSMVRWTTVDGEPAIWIEGRPHQLALPGGEVHLAGNTLLWQRGALTLRLEAKVGLERARALAASFR